MTTTLQDLKPSQITPHKHNPRRKVGDVDELAESIKAQGLLEPLIVAPNGTNGTGKVPTFLLIAGHRRLAAVKVAKLKTVQCLVRADLVDDEAAQLETMLVENLQRTDLTPIEEAEAYQQLLAFPGYNQTRIAATTGRAIATVRGRLKLAKLPDSTREKIHAGQINMSDATSLLEFVTDTARYKRLERAIGTTSWGYELARVREEQQRDKRAAKCRKELADAGVRTLQTRPMAGALSLYGPNIDQHRDCEGFAAYIGYAGTAEYVCTKPELHKPDDDTDPDDGPRNSHVATPELTAAAEQRRKFLLGLLNDPTAELAAGCLRDWLTDQIGGRGWLTEALGLTTDSTADDTAAVLSKFTALQLCVLSDLAENEYTDERLETPVAWSYSGAWLDRLEQVYGYEWTEAERAMRERFAPPADDSATDGES